MYGKGAGGGAEVVSRIKEELEVEEKLQEKLGGRGEGKRRQNLLRMNYGKKLCSVKTEERE